MSDQENLNNISTNEKIEEEVNEEVNENVNDISTNEKENEKVNENVSNNKASKSKNKTVRTKRSDPTKGELVALAKKRAIDNFEKGIADPEYRVTKMVNGKYRCFKRKVDLPPEPIKQDQIPKNLKSSDVVSDKQSEPINDKQSFEPITDKIKDKKKKDKNDPFADIVYFNLNNQMNEQLNKRLDLINHEIEKLHSKNTKLKGKYKQLKQAIYVTESDDENEKTTQDVEVHENTSTPTSTEPVTQPVTQPVIHRKTNGINFNQYFN